MVSFNWNCPFCNHAATITDSNFRLEEFQFDMDNVHGRRLCTSQIIVCPNKDCKEFSLSVFLYDTKPTGMGHFGKSKLMQYWRLIPTSNAKVFPSYIPQPILNDYSEACLIKNLSPKASATLSRRCLQGMIRDFWGVKKHRLIDEIEAIKEKVDPLTWTAIDAVRKIGNIGAHMEKDINLIIDVESDEATQLINLIEILLKDWYILPRQLNT